MYTFAQLMTTVLTIAGTLVPAAAALMVYLTYRFTSSRTPVEEIKLVGQIVDAALCVGIISTFMLLMMGHPLHWWSLPSGITTLLAGIYSLLTIRQIKRDITGGAGIKSATA